MNDLNLRKAAIYTGTAAVYLIGLPCCYLIGMYVLIRLGVSSGSS